MNTTSKCLTSLGASRIHKNEVIPTLIKFSEFTGIPFDDLVTLGSTLKQPTSGDIDIALDISKYNHSTIHSLLTNKYDGKFNAGNNIGSYLFPVAGTSKFVQIDLMYVDNIEWAKFAYFSAGDKSEYKGAIRTLLLCAVTAIIHIPEYTKFVYSDNGELIFRSGLTFDLNDGVRSIIQYRKQKNNGSFNKTFTNLSFDEARKVFPEYMGTCCSKFEPIKDPMKCCNLLFSDTISPKDVETTEQVIQLIERFYPTESTMIYSLAKCRGSQLCQQKNITIPSVMLDS